MIKDLKCQPSVKLLKSKIVLPNLLQVLRDKDEVDAAEAKLCDAEEHINDNSGSLAKPPQPETTGGGKSCVSHIRISKKSYIRPLAEFLGAVHKDVHAVHADRGHQDKTLETAHISILHSYKTYQSTYPDFPPPDHCS